MRDSWEIRFEWIQTVLQWAALVVGVGLSVLEIGVEPATMAAASAVTAYTVAMQAIPRRHKETAVVATLLALLGVVTSLFAIALTGGVESGYLLYLLVPVFYASAFQGMLLGGITTLAAIGGLAAVVGSGDQEILSPTVMLMIGVYALVGITFAQAHRILIEEPKSAPEIEQHSRLETAHRLLADLAGLASSAELNPITIGRATLRDLAVTVPFSAATIAIVSEDEDIIVATRGQPGPLGGSSTHDITMEGAHLGTLRLWPMPGESATAHDQEIEHSLQSVALAFDNVFLLQSIAGRAVREERMRLARALHDNIGPSLVSIGLGLDLMIHQADSTPPTGEDLATMRQSVGEVVEDVRATVTHLRASDTMSLREHAQALAADAPADGPSFVVSVEETCEPSGLAAVHLNAIMAEAVRNAIGHSGATIVRVDGAVDRKHGWFSVVDDGRGMDPTAPVGAHFGLVGMQERADEIGAKLHVVSGPGTGTAVKVTWGYRK